MSETQNLITIVEAAAALNCSRSNLELLVRHGLPAVNVAPFTSTRRRLRFDLYEVREWLRSRSESETAA